MNYYIGSGFCLRAKVRFYHKMKFLIKYIFLLTVVSFSAHSSFAQKKKKGEERTSAQLQEAEALFTEGMKWYMLEDYEKSIPSFEKALDITPGNGGIFYALSNAYAKLKEEDKAIPNAEKAVAQDPNNASFGILLSELYVKKHRYEDAVMIYKDLIEKDPSNAEYNIELAAVYIFDGKYQDAIKAYDRAERIMGVTEELTHQKQLVLLKEGKVEDAIKEGEKLITSDPEEIEYKIDQAELLMTNKRNDQAIPYLEKILKVNPENAQSHVMLAQIYQEKGDIEKCNRELELAFADSSLDATTKARILISYVGMMKDDKSKTVAYNLVKTLIKSNPGDPKSHAIYGDLLLQKGETENARNEYVIAARLDKSINEVWSRIIQLDFELKQLDSAIIHSEEAIEVFPNQSVFWFQNGTAYYLKQNHEKAIESLEEARRLAPAGYELAQHIDAQLGDTYNSMGKHEKSDEAYEAALKENPNNDHVLNNYSYFLSLRKQKLEKAREMAEKLVERNPNNGTFLDTYAWVLYVNKEYAKAKVYLEKALEGSKASSGTVVEHYGDILFQLGDKEKATEQWKKAKNLGGTSTLIDKKITEQKIYE